MDWVKTETGQKVEDGSVVVVMVVMSVMAVPGVFESLYKRNGAGSRSDACRVLSVGREREHVCACDGGCRSE